MTIELGWACPSPDEITLEAFEDLLDAVSNAGYSGIEPLISGPFQLDPSKLNQLMDNRNLNLIGVRTGAIGMKYGVYLSQVEEDSRAQAIDALKEVIRYSADFGKPKILVGLLLGRIAEGINQADALVWISEGIRPCAAEAERLGLEIDIEPINRNELGYNRTVAECLKLLDQIGAPNVKLLLDTFHMSIEENSIPDALMMAGNRIGHIHLADSNRTAPGQGNFDFKSFFDQLSNAGYAGPMTVECDCSDPKVDLRESMDFLSQFVNS